MDRPQNTCLVPCGHTSICDECVYCVKSRMLGRSPSLLPTFMSEPSALMPLEAPRRTAIASYARSS